MWFFLTIVTQVQVLRTSLGQTVCHHVDQREIKESGREIYCPPPFLLLAFVAQSRMEENVYGEDQRPLRVELYNEIAFRSLLNKLPSVSQVLEYLSVMSAPVPRGPTSFGCLGALSAFIVPKLDKILGLFCPNR